MSRNKWILIVVLVLTVSLAGCQEKETSEDLIPQSLIIPEEVKYETIQAEQTAYVLQDTIIKTKTYEYPVGEYLTWDVNNSRLSELIKKSNSLVDAGEALATFDVEESKADLAELQLELERQQSQMADEKSQRQAAIDAAKADMENLTSYEREIAVLELEKLQANYEKYCYQAEQNLASIQKRINELVAASKVDTLNAPGDGQVTLEAQSLKSGDKVSVGTTLYYIQYRETWYLIVSDEIPYNTVVYFYGKEDFEKYYPENMENAKALYTGTVVTSPDILPGMEREATRVKMDTPCTAQDLGKTVMYIPGEEIQGLIAVPGALNQEGDKYYVNVLEDDVVKKRYVIRGPEETVLDGITEGQILILD